MTQKEALQILAILKAAYPNFYKGMSKEEAMGTVNVWAVQFANIPADIVLMSVNKLIATSQFPPAISEVKKKFSSLYWEAWEVLRSNKNLTDEQVRYYEYIKEYTHQEQYISHEPTIQEMLRGGSRQLMLGGTEDG